MIHIDIHNVFREPFLYLFQQNGIQASMNEPEPQVNGKPKHSTNGLSCLMTESIRILEGGLDPSDLPLILIGPLEHLHLLEKVQSTGRVYSWLVYRDGYDDMIRAYESIREGEIHFGFNVKKFLALKRPARQERLFGRPVAGELTSVELEVLLDIGDGLLSKHIADKRYKSIETVHTQRKTLKRKLGLTGHEHLTGFAARRYHQVKTLVFLDSKF